MTVLPLSRWCTVTLTTVTPLLPTDTRSIVWLNAVVFLSVKERERNFFQTSIRTCHPSVPSRTGVNRTHTQIIHAPLEEWRRTTVPVTQLRGLYLTGRQSSAIYYPDRHILIRSHPKKTQHRKANHHHSLLCQATRLAHAHL
jgi:hypothetical protein